MMKFSDWTMHGETASIDCGACEVLLKEASTSPRLRTHRLLHENHADTVQRLLVAFAQGTYIQPHRHPEQWEMITLMQGALALLLFSADGRVTRRTELSANATPILQIPAGV